MITLLALGILCVSVAAKAQSGCINDHYGNVRCGPAGSHCMKDRLGDVRCSTADGGIMLDRYKVPVCGPGNCIANRHGDIVCSSVPKGSVALNAAGDPVCTSGCVPAAASACVIPQK